MMGSDFVADDVSIAALSRDIAKKKRTHRSAKLKQCKLDARREQWLSQVKNKDSVVTGRGPVGASPPPHPALSKKLDRKPKEEEGKEELRVSAERDGSNSHDSEEGSPIHMISLNGCPRNCMSSGSSFGSSWRSISDAEPEGDDGEDRGEEEEEEEEMDDWEALADALSADDHDQPGASHVPTNPDPTTAPDSNHKDHQECLVKPDAKQAVRMAWRPDDASRPQSLPNLSKQRSFPVSIERRTAGWAHNGILSMPSSCPICYEDLDPTDSSFLPCNCGFRLCLFCHKRIIEADGRCPGCRKHYAPLSGGEIGIGNVIQPMALRFARSCSMISRT